MGKADLHIHTTYSFDGTATVTATLEHVARHTALDIIAITDHDAIDGALQAVELAPRYGVHVIPGIEITTAEGHLLALYVERLIPRGLSLVRTLELIGDQGGIAIAPHPGGWWGGCLSGESIRAALSSSALAGILIGGEEYNGSLPWLGTNRTGARIVHGASLAPLASSDAHMLWMIGQGSTLFSGRTPADLRRALVQRECYPLVRTRPWYYLGSYLVRQSLRSAGLAQWSAPVKGARIALRRLSAVQGALSFSETRAS